MPYKLQTASYRTKNGQRFECDQDILDTALGDLREQARARVKELRLLGRQAFYEGHPDGYYRVFVFSPA